MSTRSEAPLTDSDDSDAESEASLEALSDASAEDKQAVDLDAKWRPLQLHTVAKMVRDTSKTVAQVEALHKLEPLVRYVRVSVPGLYTEADCLSDKADT